MFWLQSFGSVRGLFVNWLFRKSLKWCCRQGKNRIHSWLSPFGCTCVMWHMPLCNCEPFVEQSCFSCDLGILSWVSLMTFPSADDITPSGAKSEDAIFHLALICFGALIIFLGLTYCLCRCLFLESIKRLAAKVKMTMTMQEKSLWVQIRLRCICVS